MKTAIVHDWLVSVAGGEKVVQLMHDVFPSTIYTLLHNKEALKDSFFENKKIKTSFIQKLPFAKKGYQKYLPLFPCYLSQLRFLI